MKESTNEYIKLGEVLEALPSLKFRVKLENGSEIIAYLSGKLMVHRIRILAGDTVTIETSPYDPTKGRIIYRGVSHKYRKPSA
ncbi:MAG: translation initiation factor IF-1 [bacterium]|nr:translation initiation factor IF-1 [bacterium]